jgi:hypothetical protein
LLFANTANAVTINGDNIRLDFRASNDQTIKLRDINIGGEKRKVDFIWNFKKRNTYACHIAR